MSPPPAGEATTDWWRVAAAVCAGFAVALNIGKVPAALPSLVDAFGIDLVWSGAIVSVFSVLAGLTGALIGGFAQRFGARRFALIGLAASASGAGLGASATALPLLMVGRLIEGLGFIIAAVSLPPLIAHATSDRDRPLALGVWGAFVPGGMGIMLFASPALLAFGGWRASWLAAGAAAAICALLVAWAFRASASVPPTSHALAATSEPGLGAYLRNRAALHLAGCFAAYSAQFIGLISFLPTVFIAYHDVSVPAAASMTATVVVANALGNAGAGWLLRAGVSRRQLLSLAAIVMAICALAAFAAPTPLGLRFMAVFTFAAVGGLVPGTLFAATPAYALGASGVAVLAGMLLQGASIGQVAGPLILATIVQHSGHWHSAAAFMVLSSTAMIVLARRLPEPVARAATGAAYSSGGPA